MTKISLMQEVENLKSSIIRRYSVLPSYASGSDGDLIRLNAINSIFDYLGGPISGYPDWHPMNAVERFLNSNRSYNLVDHRIWCRDGVILSPYMDLQQMEDSLQRLCDDTGIYGCILKNSIYNPNGSNTLILSCDACVVSYFIENNYDLIHGSMFRKLNDGNPERLIYYNNAGKTAVSIGDDLIDDNKILAGYLLEHTVSVMRGWEIGEPWDHIYEDMLGRPCLKTKSLFVSESGVKVIKEFNKWTHTLLGVVKRV